MSGSGSAAVEEKTTGQRLPIAPWRRRLGVSLFVLQLILPLVVMLVVAVLGLPDSVSGVLFGVSMVGGPDALLVASVALLGKDGVAELMGKTGSLVKRVTKWDAVTRRRYTIGLWVLLASLIIPTIVVLVWRGSIETSDGEAGWGFWVMLASTFAFMGAVISMGAPMWARIQAIFTWDAEIVFPTDADE
jgi:hypothetical protein